MLEGVGEAGELDRRVGLGGEEDAEVERAEAQRGVLEARRPASRACRRSSSSSWCSRVSARWSRKRRRAPARPRCACRPRGAARPGPRWRARRSGRRRAARRAGVALLRQRRVDRLVEALRQALGHRAAPGRRRRRPARSPPRRRRAAPCGAAARRRRAPCARRRRRARRACPACRG